MKEQLTVEQAAKLLGVTRQTLNNLSKRGLLPKQKSLVGHGLGGRRTFYLRSDIEKLMGASRSQSN